MNVRFKVLLAHWIVAMPSNETDDEMALGHVQGPVRPTDTTDRAVTLCHFHRTPIPRDEYAADGSPCRTPCGEPICFGCWLDVHGMGDL